MHSTDAGRTALSPSRKRGHGGIVPALLAALFLPGLLPAPASAAGKATHAQNAPPMNSVTGLEKFIAARKAAFHAKEAPVGPVKDADRDAPDADRHVAALKTNLKLSAKAVKAHAVGKASEKRKPVEADEDEGAGTDYLEAYLWYIRQRASTDGSVDWSVYPAARAHRDQMPVAPFARRKAVAAHGRVPQTPAGYEKWEFLGPRNLTTPYRIYYGPTKDIDPTYFLSGRVNSVAFDKANPGTYYMASAGGGVWKTVDSGANWTPLSDAWQSLNTSVITLDPTNSRVLYAGTGDYDGQNGVGGFGVMKSTDAGLNWTRIGAVIGQASISALVVDPENPNIVTLTSGRTGAGFLWRSTDGGATWNKAVDASSNPLPSRSWSDVVIGAADGFGVRYYYACASGDLLYRSADRGQTWVSLAPPATGNDSLPRLAASGLSPTTLYFGSSDDNKIYKSTDTGNGWFDVTNDLPVGYDWSQSFYDFRLNSARFTDAGGNPADSVYASLIDLDQSFNGAIHWQSLGQTYTNNAVLHNDQHALAINPNNPGDVLVGCDGGIFRLTYDVAQNTATFKSLNGTLGLTQFYHGSWDATDPNLMLGGSQDNASPLASGDLYNWSNPGAGDGGFCAILQSNPNVQYATSQYLSLSRTTDRWATQANISPPIPVTNPVTEPVGFIAPIALDQNDSNFGAGPTQRHYLYAASNYLYQYDDTTGQWTYHPDPADATKKIYHLGDTLLAGRATDVPAKQFVSYIAVSPSDTNRIYTGSSDGQLWMAVDQGRPYLGQTFVRINAGTTSLPAAFINYISINPSNPNDILVALSSGGVPHLWHCADTSLPANVRVWTDVDGTGATSLPNVAVDCVTHDLDDPTNTWYAGTDIGAFYTQDAGVTWTNATAPLGLPNVQVNELQAVPGTRFLNAATFGRGMWRIKLPPTTPNPATLSVISINPNQAFARGPGFTLTVTGTGFTAASVVNWNGQPRPTMFGSATSLTATIPSSDIVTPGTARVTVVNAGQISNAVDFTIIDNGTPPVTTATVSPASPDGNSGWYVSPVTVTLSATDVNSTDPANTNDVANTFYSIDGGPEQTYTGPFTDSDDGHHTVTFYSVDKEGNQEDPQKTGHTISFKIDQTPPTLAFNAQSPLANAAGWNNSTVRLPYTPTDGRPSVASGVASATPGSPLTFATEGQNQTQDVTVTDVAGNSQTFTSPSVSIDETAPVTTANEADSNGGAQITLSATDSLSGVETTDYTINGGAPQTYTAPFTVSAVGDDTVEYWSVDVASNEEAHHTITFTVNPAPGMTALSPSNVQAGRPALTLKVTGSNFIASSVVQYNGGPLATTFVSSTELDAVLPASDTTTPGQYPVTVVTSAPGGGTAGPLTFTVRPRDTTPPVTTAAVSGQGNNGRYRGPVTVTLSATDPDGPADVAATYYALDNATVHVYSGPITISSAARHTLTYWSKDRIDNEEGHRTLVFVIDASAPTTTAVVNGTGGNGRYRSASTVTLSATDPDGTADVAATSYVLDGGRVQSYTRPIPVSGTGSHSVTYWSTDVAGNEEAHHTLTLVIDASAPTTTAVLSGVSGANGWYHGAVTATLSATDPDGVADVAATYYTLDGGARQTYSSASPISVAGDGQHTVTFWSVDQVGNEETPHRSVTAKIDSVAPTLTLGAASPAANSAGWNNATVRLPYTATDATSGIASATPGSPILFTAEGRGQKKSVTATDAAGNSTSATTPVVNIDLTAPVTRGVFSSNQVTLSATDALSGLAVTDYTLDGGAAHAYTGPITLAPGSHTVIYWSVDVAGNAETHHTLNATVATPGPTVLHTFPAGIQMFSVPRDLSGIPLGQSMDAPPSALFVWDPVMVNYVISPTAPADALRLGQAYWARFHTASRLFDMGKPASTTSPFAIALKTGWNMIGDPFNASVSVKDLVIVDGTGRNYSISDAATAGLIGPSLYSYPAGSTAYTVQTVPGGTVDPYLGYWIYSHGNVTLLVPASTNRVPL